MWCEVQWTDFATAAAPCDGHCLSMVSCLVICDNFPLLCLFHSVLNLVVWYCFGQAACLLTSGSATLVQHFTVRYFNMMDGSAGLALS